MNNFELTKYNGLYVKAILEHIEELSHREDIRELSRAYGNRFFNEHLNSIKLCLPRRNGNTVLSLILKTNLDNSCLIVPANKDIRFLQENLREEFPKIEKELFASENFSYGYESIPRLSKFDYIILNDVSEMRSKSIDELYTCVVPKAFICLG